MKHDVKITLSGNASAIILGNMVSQISKLFKKQFKSIEIDEYFQKVNFPSNYPENKNKSILITKGDMNEMTTCRKHFCNPRLKIHKAITKNLIEKFKEITGKKSSKYKPHKPLNEDPKTIGGILFPKENKPYRCAKCGKKLPVGSFGYYPSSLEIEGWKKYHVCRVNRGREKMFCENTPSQIKIVNKNNKIGEK